MASGGGMGTTASDLRMTSGEGEGQGQGYGVGSTDGTNPSYYSTSGGGAAVGAAGSGGSGVGSGTGTGGHESSSMSPAATSGSRPSTYYYSESESRNVGKENSLKNIMVLGATGTTGREVILELGRKYHNMFRVFAGIHESAPDDSNFLASVDIFRRVDANDMASLDFSGVDYLFLIPSNSENRVEQVRHYMDAAKKANVKYVLLLSTLMPPNKETLFSKQFSQMEHIVSQSGIPNTFLRTTFFQQNFFVHSSEISKEAIISLPIRQGKCAPLHVRDVARAATALLKDIHPHLNRCYNLVGPEVLNGDGIAKAASNGLGKRIQFIDVDPEEFVQFYESQGIAKWLARGFCEILQLVASNELANIDTKQFFRELTGSWPLTVEEFFRENRNQFLGQGEEETSRKSGEVYEGGRGMSEAGRAGVGVSAASASAAGGGGTRYPEKETGGSYRRYGPSAVSKQGYLSSSSSSVEESMEIMSDMLDEMLRTQYERLDRKRERMAHEESRLRSLKSMQKKLHSSLTSSSSYSAHQETTSKSYSRGGYEPTRGGGSGGGGEPPEQLSREEYDRSRDSGRYSSTYKRGEYERYGGAGGGAGEREGGSSGGDGRSGGIGSKISHYIRHPFEHRGSEYEDRPEYTVSSRSQGR